MSVIVRIFGSASAKDCAAVLETVRAHMKQQRGTRAGTVEPYPKEKGWFEVSFEATGVSFEAARDALGASGWDEGGDAGSRFAVWNPGAKKRVPLGDARVRFVNLEEAPD